MSRSQFPEVPYHEPQLRYPDNDEEMSDDAGGSDDEGETDSSVEVIGVVRSTHQAITRGERAILNIIRTRAAEAEAVR